MAYPPAEALILVCVVPEPRDLEIARVLGWYRIPLRKAPKVIGVDYLAFYQTGAFGERGSCIEFVAPVRGYELTTRAELLRDQPNHPRAREEYYKIQLGPLQPLPAPLAARSWKRITFFYTTGEYLQSAQWVDDLVVADDDRRPLWASLRERALQTQQYQVEELPDLPAELDILLLLGLNQASQLGKEDE